MAIAGASIRDLQTAIDKFLRGIDADGKQPNLADVVLGWTTDERLTLTADALDRKDAFVLS